MCYSRYQVFHRGLKGSTLQGIEEFVEGGRIAPLWWCHFAIGSFNGETNRQVISMARKVCR